MTPTRCPWCGLSGPDFNESPRPADYCEHDPTLVIDAPLLQDQSRGLSRYLANAPHARQHVREVAANMRSDHDL